MKTETRKQLIGVAVGLALGYGINQVPGLSSEAKMLLMTAIVLALAFLSTAKISAKSK